MVAAGGGAAVAVQLARDAAQRDPKFAAGFTQLKERVRRLLGDAVDRMGDEGLGDILDEWYCIDKDYTHEILTPSGQWNSRRHPQNDRGD